METNQRSNRSEAAETKEGTARLQAEVGIFHTVPLRHCSFLPQPLGVFGFFSPVSPFLTRNHSHPVPERRHAHHFINSLQFVARDDNGVAWNQKNVPRFAS